MQRRILGATGISVSDISLGTMNFGGWGNKDRAETIGMIHRAIDAGINLIDTADIYGDGESEEIVGEALKGRRDEVVLATKFGMLNPKQPNRQGASPRWVRLAIEASLRRLDVDHVDLFQLHRFDYYTGLDETIGALTDLQRAGLIRAFGHSTFPADKIVEAQWISEKRGHARFVTEQSRYAIVNREIEVAVLPTAQQYNMGVLTYSPLSNGWLSGRRVFTENYRNRLNARLFDTTNPLNAQRAEMIGELTKVAEQAGLTLPDMATAWCRAHPAVTSVIIGPRTPEQLEGSIASSDLVLSNDVLDAIDAIVPPGSDSPNDKHNSTPPWMTDARLRRRA